ncbi:MAG: Hsp20/alpha crystallin family protein [Methanospirillum sp.]|uniref:Hsp20/alpha crystallin family protein n=1 Tax=Methanospirillum sp. TaxID=45200 RepID=UPI00237212D1|nr:Hsp20/alpha crystallin family protein [Methanospirillum sp.]MDD1730224.1 Hsp20/alpha crystallin family protein [Methanospirillum sp.]
MAIIKRERDPFDALRNEMDGLFADMESRFHSLLPTFPAYSQRNRDLPALTSGGFSVDIKDAGDEVIARADIPGCEKEMVKIRLVRPNLLQITCERSDEMKEEDKDYFIRERFFGSVSRSVPLPSEVTEDNAKATFENGVLEVHFKKSQKETSGDIPIQ